MPRDGGESTEARHGRQPRSSIDPVALAKALLEQSALRQRLFDGFPRELAWDILLSLYVALHERAQLTQSAVLSSLAEPLESADGKLRRMERIGLVTRRDGSDDARNAVVEITEQAAATVERLLRDLAGGMHLYDGGLDRRS